MLISETLKPLDRPLKASLVTVAESYGEECKLGDAHTRTCEKVGLIAFSNRLWILKKGGEKITVPVKSERAEA